MPKYAVLSKHQHATRTWKRAGNYRFAERDQVALLVAQEAAAACCEMPIGFIRHDDTLELAVLLGLTPGENVFVAPDGKWLMRYVPMTLRGHPFQSVRQPGSNQAILCVDEDSECLQRGGTEPFFNEDGTPAPAVQEAMKLQTFLDAARAMTKVAVAALAKANVIVPWEISAKIGEQVRPILGFLRIDKSALDKVDDTTLLELRKLGALEIAYHQLASMHQLSTVERLVEIKEKIRAGGTPAVTSGQIADFLSNDRLIF